MDWSLVVFAAICAGAATFFFCAEYFSKRGSFWSTVISIFGIVGIMFSCACLKLITSAFIHSVINGLTAAGSAIVAFVVLYALCYANRNEKMDLGDF